MSEIIPNNRHLRKVEIYENERYSPVSGWSSRSLLITDRGVYSNGDGSMSFGSLDEANQSLLSPGWKWESENWSRDTSLTNADEHGWSYATDFLGYEDENSGSAIKSMMHFVRRKRLIRYQQFDINLIYSSDKLTCSYCDIEEIDRLSTTLLEVLTTASLKKHPRFISVPKVNSLKYSLIEAFNFSKAEPIDDYTTERILTLLEPFISHGPNAWTMASAALGGGNTTEYFGKRTVEILDSFSIYERNEISKLIIRKFDKNYTYHCNKINCKDECVFSPMLCPNTDCGVIFSKKWADKHDNICPQKIIDCERLCGEKVIRRLHNSHLETSCSLRPMKCPFNELGCSVVCAHRSLQDHLDQYMQSHLLLSLTRVEEQQTVIVSLHRRINDIETKIKEHDTAIIGSSTAISSAIAVVETNNKKQFKALHDDISKVDSKSTRHITDIAGELRGEIAKIKRSLSEIIPKK